MTIGTKIRKIRELRNYSQEYMADQLEMSQSGYSKIETDEVDVNFTKIEKIAKVLDINVMDLIGFNEKLVINNYSDSQSGGAGSGYTTINNVLSEEIKKLYDDKVKLLEDKVKMLEDKITAQELIIVLKERLGEK